MRAVPYDARRAALYNPEKGVKRGTTAKSIFPISRTPSDDLICVEASRLVYKRFENDPKEQAEIEAALANVGYGDFQPFNKNGSQAFAMWSPGQNTALMVFRGTQQDLTDFATDVDFRKTDWTPGGWVHEGFRKALDQHAGREDYFIHHSWRIGEVDVRDLADHAPINYVNVLLSL